MLRVHSHTRGQSLPWDGYRFTLNRRLDHGTCYWRCHKRSSAARITTHGADILQQTHEHNHAVNSKLRKRAREKVTPVPALCNEALVELSTLPDRSDVAPTLPTYSSFKSSMYRSRQKRLPPLPKTRAEPNIQLTLINTS